MYHKIILKKKRKRRKESNSSISPTYWTVFILKSPQALIGPTLVIVSKGRRREKHWSDEVTSPQLMGEKAGPHNGQGRSLHCVLYPLWPPTHLPLCTRCTGLPAFPMISQTLPHCKTLARKVLSPQSRWLSLFLFAFKSWLRNLKCYLLLLCQSHLSSYIPILQAHITFWNAILFTYFLHLLSFSCLLQKGKNFRRAGIVVFYPKCLVAGLWTLEE